MTDIDVSNMTPERRLNQIEILLSTAAKTINKTNEEVKEQKERITTLEMGQIELQVQIESVTNLFERTITTMARQQTEIERIWRYLQSRSGNGNSPN